MKPIVGEIKKGNMNPTNLSHSTPKARKEYSCQALDDILDHVSKDEIINASFMTADEREIMRKAIIDDGCKILVGEVYEHQVNKYEGEIYVWRCKLGVLKIADKYHLLSEPD